ncbi:hypothetical protein MTR_3g021470 [Medicago truncatula]|uniref:Uncharacterized protein n=1 Tax=Medicago truncatula TaxID=3880 RepID=G7IZ50_MEDTR|nr:hypothetical protein MTR_3g021470 [Medicago truncatula]
MHNKKGVEPLLHDPEIEKTSANQKVVKQLKFIEEIEMEANQPPTPSRHTPSGHIYKQKKQLSR